MEQMKKYELTNETKEIDGVVLHRIRSLKNFNDVKAGDLGGWIEKDNLSHNGNCWIYDNACVYGNAYVHNNAHVYGNACVHDNAHVYDNAHIYGDVYVYDNSYIYGNAYVYGNAHVCGNACVYDNAEVYGDALVNNNANIKSKFDIILFSGFGTEARTTTAFRCKDTLIRVNCGCFNGTIDEFRNRIKETRKGKYAEEYFLMCNMIERHFREE